MFRQDAGVIRVVAGQIAIWPAATIFQPLRQVPVIDRAERPNIGGKQRINKATVMIESLRIRRSRARRLNAGPRNRKSIALLMETFCYRDVLRIEMVLIAGDVRCRAALYFADCVGEPIPDRLTFSVFIPRAFDLNAAVAVPQRKSSGKCAC